MPAKPPCAVSVRSRSLITEQLAHYKVPQHIRFVSEFPMTVTGKIQKFVMRERMIEEINLYIERGPT
jgi:fatty-acyl-CoA synthase